MIDDGPKRSVFWRLLWRVIWLKNGMHDKHVIYDKSYIIGDGDRLEQDEHDLPRLLAADRKY